MRVGKTEECRDVSIVEAERGLEEAARGPHRIQAQGLVPDRLASHGEIDRVEIIGPLACRPAAFGCGELDLHHAGEPGDNLVLHAEEIGARFVEPLGPEMRPRLCVDQLRVDPDAVFTTLDAAFHDVAHAKLAADLARIDRLALVGEGGVPPDHDSAGNARQIRRQALGDAIGDGVLRGAATDIGERQHHNGKSRWARRVERGGRRDALRAFYSRHSSEQRIGKVAPETPIELRLRRQRRNRGCVLSMFGTMSLRSVFQRNWDRVICNWRSPRSIEFWYRDA
jgi:hypothetical protein